jgi:molybdate transport system substrate-binding protein
MRRRAAIARILLGGATTLALVAASDARGQSRLHEQNLSGTPLIAAAADLKFALDEVVAQFQRDTGQRVRVTYGSSGNLARQIAQGAPYELFLSADEQYVRWLADRALTRGEGELYAIGRIVIFAPQGSPLRPDERLSHLARRLSDGTVGRIAIANPEHAPYGRAAEQALRSLGLWEAARPHLVLGENVAQAAQFAASGNADGGLIAHSLALAPELRRRGSFALIPESLHEPLRQRMVLLVSASPAAERFYEYLRAPAGRGILAGHGFALPGE